MKPSLIFRIQRFIYFLLKGRGKKETEHFLFQLVEPLSDFELYQRLADTGWTPNYLGYIYSGQIYQCRRLVEHGEFQYHLRFYDTGIVTGHREVSAEWDEHRHLHPNPGDLRTMNKEESEELHGWLEQRPD